MLITSKENSKIKYINKLKEKKYRDEEKKFLVETYNLLKEASDENLLLEVYLLEGESLPFEVDIPVYSVTKEVMNKIKKVSTSKAVGICKKKEESLSGSRLLLLDTVQDPGNLGTIIRSAKAFNVDTVILSPSCCDIYNDKVVRSAEGALFKINILKKDLKEVIETLIKDGIPLFGTDVEKGEKVSVIPKDRFGLVIGSEGQGISKDISKLLTKNVHIKTQGVESLNVAIATSIILYELNK